MDHPVIFSAAMVQALLAGRKAQTRRLAWREWSGDGPPQAPKPSPWQRVKPGDRLYVREAFASTCSTREMRDGITACTITYREGNEESPGSGPRVDVKWRPSIHMPRWASRLTLTVTDVRVERLQDISEEDAKAEGVEPAHEPAVAGALVRAVMPAAAFTAHRTAFAHLWEALHGPGSWEANPAIVRVAFTVAKRNIDRF